MEKKIWSKPEMNEFAFAANEYVAACGDSGTNYLFTCDAGGGKYGRVWMETNSPTGDWNGLQTDEVPGYWDSQELDQLRTDSYHACKKTHTASSEDEFSKGYYISNDDWNSGWSSSGLIPVFNLAAVIEKAIKVYIWGGPEKTNTHCTTNLDIDNWETAKS